MAAAAYRAGEKLRNERTGLVHDYTRRDGVESAAVLLPGGEVGVDRLSLWNAAEAAEKRKDARTAREIIIALPDELAAGDRQALAQGFAQSLADQYGVAVDCCLHTPSQAGDERNHHAHLLMTTRHIQVIDGRVQFGDKSRLELSDTRRASLGLDKAADDITRIRQAWAQQCNDFLTRAGHESRVDHRSLAAQGIDRAPTMHLGATATEMERAGKGSDRGDVNRQITSDNVQRAHLGAQILDFKKAKAEKDRLLEQHRQARQAVEAATLPELRKMRGQLNARQPAVAIRHSEALQAVDERITSLRHSLDRENKQQARMVDEAKQWKQDHRLAFWLHSKGLIQSKGWRQIEKAYSDSQAKVRDYRERIEQEKAQRQQIERKRPPKAVL